MPEFHYSSNLQQSLVTGMHAEGVLPGAQPSLRHQVMRAVISGPT
jgi:hypothetical protein